MSDTRKPDTRKGFTLARKLKRLVGIALLVTLASCSTLGSHNAAGGYRDACGELPGLIGDDC